MAEELRILYEDPYLVVCVKPVAVAKMALRPATVPP